jgi:CheY-like chemotaxis protein
MPGDAKGQRLRLLLVEDYDLVRISSARALRSTFTVTPFASAEEALVQVRPGAFDVVLTDFRMPAMTGIELLEQLRLRDPRIRRVLMSGIEVPGLLGYRAAGLVQGFLLKPFDPRTARAVLDPSALQP